MQIEQSRIDIDSRLAEARRAAELGNVPASDIEIQTLFQDATRCQVPLREAQLKQVAEIQNTARARGVERLLVEAESEADAGEVIESDLTVETIRTYAQEAALTLTEDQEQRIKGIYRAARKQAIDNDIEEIVGAAKYGRVQFVDSRLERIFRHAGECSVTLSDEQHREIRRCFIGARKRAIKRALMKLGSSDDLETLRGYAEEADIKLSKKDESKLKDY